MLSSSQRASRLLPSQQTGACSRLELPRFRPPRKGSPSADSRKRVQQPVPTGAVLSNLPPEPRRIALLYLGINVCRLRNPVELILPLSSSFGTRRSQLSCHSDHGERCRDRTYDLSV